MAEVNSDYNEIYEDLEDIESLDDLLGAESDVTTKEEDVFDYGDIEHPHIIVKSSEFNHILKVSSILRHGISKFTKASSVGIEVVDGHINFHLSNGSDIFYNYKTDLVNSDNLISGFFSLSSTVLATVARAFPSLIVIYKKEERYFIKLVGGDVELSETDALREELSDSNFDNYKDYGVIYDSLNNIIKKFHPLVSSSPVSMHRKIYFDDGAYVLFLQGACQYVKSDKIPKFNLGLKESKLLYYMLDYHKNGEYKVSKFENNSIMFEGENFSFSIAYEAKRISKFGDLLSAVNTIHEYGDYNYVDTSQLLNILFMSVSLPHSISIVEFNYNDGGNITCKMRTKKSDSVFELKGEAVSDVKPLGNNIAIQSMIIKSFINSFSSDSNLGVVLSDTGVGLKSDDYKGAIFVEGDKSSS